MPLTESITAVLPYAVLVKTKDDVWTSVWHKGSRVMIYHSQWSMSLRLYETGHWRVIQRPRPLRNPRTRALGISSLVPPTVICRKARDPRDSKNINRNTKQVWKA